MLARYKISLHPDSSQLYCNETIPNRTHNTRISIKLVTIYISISHTIHFWVLTLENRIMVKYLSASYNYKLLITYTALFWMRIIFFQRCGENKIKTQKFVTT